MAGLSVRPPVLRCCAALAALAAGRTLAAQAPPIRDNSFLVEEAYNQDRGVVQHIGTFARSRDGSWLLNVTQEWPLGGMRHQASYAIALLHDRANGTGPGDVMLNYRYQLTGSARGTERVFTAPRLTVVLPTGSSRASRGAGAVGVQAALPVSVQLATRLVVHGNAGLAVTPRSRNAAGDRATTWGMNLGASMVWLFRPDVNLLLEGVWQRAQSVTGDHATGWSSTTLLNPGVRWAFNFRSGLQIVPGVAWTVDLTPDSELDGVFAYLSVEHAFR